MHVYIAVSENANHDEIMLLKYLHDIFTSEGNKVSGPIADKINNINDEMAVSMKEYFEINLSLLNDADIVLTEVSNPSHEVGYVIGYAISHEKPVVSLYRDGVWVSRMIVGNKNQYLFLRPYSSKVEALNHVREVIDIFKN